MPYELVKKFRLEERPYPCSYCDVGWSFTSFDGIHTCHDSCELYEIWLEGGIVVPQGFDEAREV